MFRYLVGLRRVAPSDSVGKIQRGSWQETQCGDTASSSSEGAWRGGGAGWQVRGEAALNVWPGVRAVKGAPVFFAPLQICSVTGSAARAKRPVSAQPVPERPVKTADGKSTRPFFVSAPAGSRAVRWRLGWLLPHQQKRTVLSCSVCFSPRGLLHG